MYYGHFLCWIIHACDEIQFEIFCCEQYEHKSRFISYSGTKVHKLNKRLVDISSKVTTSILHPLRSRNLLRDSGLIQAATKFKLTPIYEPEIKFIIFYHIIQVMLKNNFNSGSLLQHFCVI